MTRRNVLKSIGAGVSLSAITMFDDETARIGDHEFDPEEEVPYIAAWENDLQPDGSVEKSPSTTALPRKNGVGKKQQRMLSANWQLLWKTWDFQARISVSLCPMMQTVRQIAGLMW